MHRYAANNRATALYAAARRVVFVLALAVLTLVVPQAFNAPPTASAQDFPVGVSTYRTNSPHWPHINVLDFGRAVQWLPSGVIRTAGYEWYARHVDAMEISIDRFTSPYGSTASTYVKSLNPSLETFGYDIDLTMCQHLYCRDENPANTAQNNLPEDQYLHFSEDTQIRYYGYDGVTELGTFLIPGCPAPGPVTADCRVSLYIWKGYRWVANLQNAAWRQWFADHLIAEMELNANGQPNPVNAIFLDEHALGFSLTMGIGDRNQILSGGGIREYGGVAPRNYVTTGYYNLDAFDAAYNADVVTWLTYLATRLNAVGKDVRPNLAGYFMKTMGFQQAAAANGVMTEHLHAADELIGAAEYQQFLNYVSQLVAAGGTVDLAGTTCDQGPAGYTSGNYSSAFDRFRIWNLASYYVAKESVTDLGMVYFNPNLCIEEESATPLSFQDEWLAAYEVNVGQPQSAAAVYQQGPLDCATEEYKIFARQYTNALSLVRPRGGTTCTDYSDATAVTVPLEAPMVMLKPDGTYSTPMSSVSIRNAEAVILVSAPDISAPSAVNDFRTE